MKHKTSKPIYIDVKELLDSLKQDVPRYSKFAWLGLPDGSYIIELKTKGRQQPLTNWLKLQKDPSGSYQVILDVPDEQEKLIWSNDPAQEKHPSVITEDSKVKAFIIADEYIIDNFYDNVNLLLLDAQWREEPATEKQLSLIRSKKLYTEEDLTKDLTKGEAFTIIGLTNYFVSKVKSSSNKEHG